MNLDTIVVLAERFGIAFVLFLVMFYFYMKDKSKWVKDKTMLEAELAAKEKECDDFIQKFQSCSKSYADFRVKYENDVLDSLTLMRSLIDQNADHAKHHEVERDNMMNLVKETSQAMTRLAEVMKSLESWVRYRVKNQNGKTTNGRSKK